MRSGGVTPGARGGWALAEVLVCAVIISATAACVVEFTGVTSRMSSRSHERSAISLDLWSIANAADRCSAGGVSRGGWKAGVTTSPAKGGLRRADIRADSSDDMASHHLVWAAWDIEGRRR
jgi:hypothetical protein